MATKKKILKRSSNRDNCCKFCNKGFASEKTLIAHMCPKKRRFKDKDTPGAQLGFRVFQRFNELSMNSKKPKTEMDFINSSFYAEFVKFARYLIALNPLGIEGFIDFLIKNAIPLKSWSSEGVYEEYLYEFTKKELPDRAIERTIIAIDEWATTNNCEMGDFFKAVHPVEATYLIKSGHISPWALYLADTAGELFARFNSEQATIISNIIDPDHWHKEIMRRKDDVSFIRSILAGAQL